MLAKKTVLNFHEGRLIGINKILNKLYELRDSLMVTRSIDNEISIQEGERDFTLETILLLKSDKNKNGAYVVGGRERFDYEKELEHSTKLYNDRLKDPVKFKIKINPEDIIEGNPIAVNEGGISFAITGRNLKKVLDDAKYVR